jgi:hypothetical protein
VRACASLLAAFLGVAKKTCTTNLWLGKSQIFDLFDFFVFSNVTASERLKSHRLGDILTASASRAVGLNIDTGLCGCSRPSVSEITGTRSI